MPAYNPLDLFEIIDNSFSIGGHSFEELIKLGCTSPFYIYSKEIIDKKINELRNCLPNQLQIYYSIKANPFKDIVTHLANQVDGFDVSSLSELELALSTNINPNRICYTGPGKCYDELSTAVSNNVLISAESKTELLRIDKLGNNLNIKPTALIRINPNFTQARAGIKMASGSSPFGIDFEQAIELLDWVKSTCIKLDGFHIYTGSQILDANAINQSQTKTFELLTMLAKIYKQPIKKINIGGGFGIPYFPKHTPLNLNSVAENFRSLIPTLDENLFSKDIKPIIELGRYIVGESGVYVCKIIDIKISQGKKYLVADGGMHHHLAASGNLGQKNRKNFPIIVANKIYSDKQEAVDIVGKLCTPLDKLAEDVVLNECKVGDYIAIMQSGAYGLSASPNNFLSHPIAEEILL